MSNPFEDEQMDSNPFEDPSVSNALHSTDSYETVKVAPFALPPTGGDMSGRLEDLARRESELAARETALERKAEHIRKHGRNNWPPGPFPLIFHDIDMEIPEESKSTVLTMYRIWMFLVIVLLVNMVGGVFLLISGANNGGSDLIASVVYVPVISILSFLMWYRPVYNAYMKESAVFYYAYFVFGGFHIAYCTYMFIGIPSSGSAGLINLISRFANGSILAGIFCILATIGWAMETLACVWMYKQVYAHSNGEKGHTFAEAKREMQVHGLRAYLFKNNISAV